MYSLNVHLVCVFLVPYGNLGCKGGNMYDAFLYIVANDGVDTSSAYPYQGQVRVCLIGIKLHN